MNKPTIEEIEAYCKERGNHVDPVKFWNYYESIGWKIGKHAMKCWQACVHTWERNTTHSMAIQGRDEAYKANKEVYTLPDKPKVTNPAISKLVQEQYTLTKGLRGANASQRILLNKKIRLIHDKIQAIKDADMRLKL